MKKQKTRQNIAEECGGQIFGANFFLIAVEIIDPRVAIGTFPLARTPLANIAFVFKLAFVFPATGTPDGPIRKWAPEDGGVLDRFQGHRVFDPIDQFLTGYEIYVW